MYNVWYYLCTYKKYQCNLMRAVFIETSDEFRKSIVNYHLSLNIWYLNIQIFVIIASDKYKASKLLVCMCM